MPYSEFRRRSLSVSVWSQAFYDLLTTRASLRYYLAKSFRQMHVPQELVDYAFATSHQAGARFAPLYFLGGNLFTTDVRRNVYKALRIPVQVLCDRDAYVGFDLLDEFVDTHPNWSVVRIPQTNGLPQWEKPEETVAALDEFFSVTGPGRPSSVDNNPLLS